MLNFKNRVGKGLSLVGNTLKKLGNGLVGLVTGAVAGPVALAGRTYVRWNCESEPTASNITEPVPLFFQRLILHIFPPFALLLILSTGASFLGGLFYGAAKGAYLGVNGSSAKDVIIELFTYDASEATIWEAYGQAKKMLMEDPYLSPNEALVRLEKAYHLSFRKNMESFSALQNMNVDFIRKSKEEAYIAQTSRSVFQVLRANGTPPELASFIIPEIVRDKCVQTSQANLDKLVSNHFNRYMDPALPKPYMIFSPATTPALEIKRTNQTQALPLHSPRH